LPIAGLQTGQELVEVGVAGGDAGDRVAAVVGLLEVVHHLGEQLLDGAGRVGDPLLGDVEHLGLGLVERLDDVVGLAVGELGDVAGRVDELAEQRRLLDDLGVVARRRDRRRGVLQLVERLGPADLGEQTGPAQLVGDGDGVCRGGARVQGADRVEDVAVRRAVEVLRVEPHLADDADRLAREQHGAEHRLLGVDVVRWDPTARRAASRVAAVGGAWSGITAGIDGEVLVTSHGVNSLP
jgi:hypothetical protein